MYFRIIIFLVYFLFGASVYSLALQLEQSADSSTLDKKSVDSIASNKIHEYSKYFWKQLVIDSNLNEINKISKIKISNFNNSKVDSSSIGKYIEDVIVYCENNGYPFAELYFADVKIQKDSLSATLKLNLNDLILIDSVRIISNSTLIHKNFIQAYLDIREGDIYNESLLKQVDKKINDLGFINTKSNSVVYFINKKAELVVYPNKVSSNRFDGLIGIQPNASTNKTSLIGQVNLNLINTLKRADKFSFDFRAQPNSTRDLKINLSYPFVFGLPFGVDAAINFRRQDSSFSIFSPEIGLSYLFNGVNSLRLIYRIENSNLLSTKQFQNLNTLPNILDVNKRFYGLNLQFEQTDYRLNPKKGFRLSTQVLFGEREITKNSAFADSLYDGVIFNSNQILFQLKVQKFLNLYKKNVIMIGLNTLHIDSKNLLFNELYRIGGINDLRGFDEESIYVSSSLIATVEYRLLLDRNSFIRAFYDYVYLQNVISSNNYLRGNGVGVGFQIATNAGLLQLSYALGQLQNSAFNFQNGKIHFGIINYF